MLRNACKRLLAVQVIDALVLLPCCCCKSPPPPTGASPRWDVSDDTSVRHGSPFRASGCQCWLRRGRVAPLVDGPSLVERRSKLTRSLPCAAAIAVATSGGPWVQPAAGAFRHPTGLSHRQANASGQPAQFAGRDPVHPPAPADVVRRLRLMRPGFPIKTGQLSTAYRSTACLACGCP